MTISISQTQLEQIPAFVEEWLKRVVSVEPVDRAAAERGFAQMYANINASPPKVLWFSSPFKAFSAVASGVVKNGGKATRLRARLFDQEITKAESGILPNLPPRIGEIVRREFYLIDPETGCDALSGSIATVQAELMTRIQLICETLNKPSPDLKIANYRGLLLQLLDAGVRDSWKMGLFAYARDVLGVVHDLQGHIAVANVPWYWPFERVVLASETPRAIVLDDKGRLHNRKGYAIEYENGDGVCCLNGIRVPHDIGGIDWGGVEELQTNKPVQEVLVGEKIKSWSEAAPATSVETEEEREAAAFATKRLGGIGAVRDLTEGES